MPVVVFFLFLQNTMQHFHYTCVAVFLVELKVVYVHENVLKKV